MNTLFSLVKREVVELQVRQLYHWKDTEIAQPYYIMYDDTANDERAQRGTLGTARTSLNAQQTSIDANGPIMSCRLFIIILSHAHTDSLAESPFAIPLIIRDNHIISFSHATLRDFDLAIGTASMTSMARIASSSGTLFGARL